MTSELTPPPGWRPSYTFGRSVGENIALRIAAREDNCPTDRQLQSQALLDVLTDFGWDVYLAGDRIGIIRVNAVPELAIPGFEDPSFLRGFVDALSARLAEALVPFLCPRCGVARSLIEDQPCFTCQEVSADG